MSIAYILSFMFFYLALALIFYSICITSEVDDIMEKQNRQYWHIEYDTQGGEQDAN